MQTTWLVMWSNLPHSLSYPLRLFWLAQSEFYTTGGLGTNILNTNKIKAALERLNAFPKLNIGKHFKCTTSTPKKKTSTFSLIFIMFLKSINLHCTFSSEGSLIPLILKKVHEALWPTKWEIRMWPEVAKTQSFILFQGKPNEKNNTS